MYVSDVMIFECFKYFKIDMKNMQWTNGLVWVESVVLKIVSLRDN